MIGLDDGALDGLFTFSYAGQRRLLLVSAGVVQSSGFERVSSL